MIIAHLAYNKSMDREELKNKGVSTHSGFPNAAEGSHAKQLDLTRLLIKHPSSTFLMRLDSDEWAKEGMHEGDIIIVDRALEPKKPDLVIWWDQSQFVIGNKSKVPVDCEIWGVVASVVHQMRKS